VSEAVPLQLELAPTDRIALAVVAVVASQTEKLWPDDDDGNGGSSSVVTFGRE